MNYYIDINGKTMGPLTLNQVKALYESGKVEDSFLYATEGSKDWMPISFLVPMFDVKENSTPPVPQPQLQPTIVVNNNVLSNNQGFAPQVPTTSYKSKVTYRVLALFFGALGIHNFYVGRKGIGTIQLLLTLFSGGLLTAGIWLWALIESFVIEKDGNGNALI